MMSNLPDKWFASPEGSMLRAIMGERNEGGNSKLNGRPVNLPEGVKVPTVKSSLQSRRSHVQVRIDMLTLLIHKVAMFGLVGTLKRAVVAPEHLQDLRSRRGIVGVRLSPRTQKNLINIEWSRRFAVETFGCVLDKGVK